MSCSHTLPPSETNSLFLIDQFIVLWLVTDQFITMNSSVPVCIKQTVFNSPSSLAWSKRVSLQKLPWSCTYFRGVSPLTLRKLLDAFCPELFLVACCSIGSSFSFNPPNKRQRKPTNRPRTKHRSYPPSPPKRLRLQRWGIFVVLLSSRLPSSNDSNPCLWNSDFNQGNCICCCSESPRIRGNPP